ISTGIDFQAIVDATVLAEQRRIDLVVAKQAGETAKLTAIQGFNGLLLGLLTSAHALSGQDDFQVQTVTSSLESLVTASITGNAALGTHSLRISQLAQAHQLASQGFANIDTTSIGAGTVSIQVGSGATTVIDVDAGNNTLGGLRDAINNSEADVTATIINDGSALNPYRLLLIANDTGAANTIDITLNLAGGTAPDFANNNIDSVETGPANSTSYTGTASALGTYTGTQNQAFIVEIMNGGAVGAATFRFSTDGGQTFNDNGGAGFLTSEVGTLLEDGVSIAFSNSGTLTAGDRFNIDVFIPTVQVAQDAAITLGSDSGGGAPITITSESNTITEIIPGVTLNLLGADPSTTIRISVENDTEAVRVAIEGFVESYNAVIDFMNKQLRYDTMTEEGGLLLGDTLLVTVQNDLRQITTGVIAGLPMDMNRLTAIGIKSVPETGKLIIDSSKLQEALSSNPAGIADLFSTSSTSTNPDIMFLNSTAKTVLSSDGFTVDITAAATRGTLEGTAIGGFPLTLTTANNQIRLEVDGKESSVLTLPAKTYATGDELATEIQAQLNADSELAGRGITVEFTGGRLVFTSSSFGSSSSVKLGAEPENSAFAILGLIGAAVVAGQDVAGTINGESATGSGQILTGDAGNATTDGLALFVTLRPSEVNPAGPEAVVTLIDGIAARVSDRLKALTDSSVGRLANRTNTLTRQIDDLDADIQRMGELLEEKRHSLLDQFARLEASLALLNSQGDFLVQQLANLPRIDTFTRRSKD
ncbi:MAG: flagellar filament capping protein FliD, partial [Candidatus Abyssubacteria bacterium]|nr:flagellar filament capping protein FliD [Candidatus Abyssubacteria bacterium]